METQRAFTAVILSLIILLSYQYFFMPTPPENIPGEPTNQQLSVSPPQAGMPSEPVAVPINGAAPVLSSQNISQPQLTGRDIAVETGLYQAVITENGGVIKSFHLKDYQESATPESGHIELIKANASNQLPLNFSWGNGLPTTSLSYSSSQDNIAIANGSSAHLTMVASPQPGLEIERTMVFTDDSYGIQLEITVKNNTDQALQGAPFLSTTNRPFSKELAKNQFLFHGPAVYMNDVLQEIKVADLKDDGPLSLNGKLSWAAYEDTYFLCAILPEDRAENTVKLSTSGEDTVTSTINGKQDVILAGAQKKYIYTVYLGPKRLATLQGINPELAAIINFGWFDILAKPTLHLLNFLYRYLHNYGFAIILVTVLFKAILWPVSYRGMKSMKTMQKIQPKMMKLKEKYQNDKERLNQEMIALYKTYKVNPVGGCLPMLLQIPVFFALYKVLLQTIELRHAPFIGWITDLSAPDRLPIGFDLPFLGGIPVLTLLMGASMFLQQKMTPASADPTQARVMLFLPVIFTFMFLNFASGLVLYWFINNLLSIIQQYFINRSES